MGADPGLELLRIIWELLLAVRSISSTILQPSFLLRSGNVKNAFEL